MQALHSASMCAGLMDATCSTQAAPLRSSAEDASILAMKNCTGLQRNLAMRLWLSKNRCWASNGSYCILIRL